MRDIIKRVVGCRRLFDHSSKWILPDKLNMHLVNMNYYYFSFGFLVRLLFDFIIWYANVDRSIEVLCHTSMRQFQLILFIKYQTYVDKYKHWTL